MLLSHLSLLFVHNLVHLIDLTMEFLGLVLLLQSLQEYLDSVAQEFKFFFL